MHEGPFSFSSCPPSLDKPPQKPASIPKTFQEGGLLVQDICDVEDAGLTTTLKRATGSTIGVFEARSAATFDVFGLPQELVQGVYSAMEFDRPSEIQALSLPLICKDPFYSLIAQAQNGSGKTCCFTLCILTRLDYNLHSPQALVVVPTRELAVQNETVIRRMGSFTKATVLSSRSHNEVQRRQSPISEMVVVGTIGSLERWRQKSWLTFNNLRVVVFDEADVMIQRDTFGDHSLAMMMYIDIEAQSPPQILLFSATYNEKVREYAEMLFNSFKSRVVRKIYVPAEELSLDTISHANVKCDGFYDKLRIIKERILPNCGLDESWAVTAISGEMEFVDRDRVVSEFRNSTTSILVSTDVLARGPCMLKVNTVINFDIPRDYETHEPAYETYLHRVGRSGRFRRFGAAFNLTDIYRLEGHDMYVMEQIAMYYDREIKFLDVDDDAALKAFLERAGVIQDAC